MSVLLKRLLVLCVVLSGLAISAPINAQDASSEGIIVAIPDNFPGVHDPRPNDSGIQALVYFGRADGSDVVLLNPVHATPEGIRVALFTIHRFQGTDIGPNTILTIPIMRTTPRSAVQAAAGFARILGAIRGSRPSVVPGLGMAGRWIRVPDATGS